MLVVKYKVSEQRLKHNFEAPAHLFCVGAAFLPAIAGVFLELYNEANIWCWIASVPKGCLNSITNNGVTTCIRGDNAFLYRYVLQRYCVLSKNSTDQECAYVAGLHTDGHSTMALSGL